VDRVVEAEAKKGLDRERSLADCGSRQIREKVCFNWL